MSGDADVVSTMRRAITAVRREGYKAAVVYAILDGTLLALLTMLLLSVFRVEIVPRQYPAVAVGVLGAIASVAGRVRRPIVERFEAVNPEVHEALRTARDVLDEEDTSTMARALYADVIDRLQSTSSVGLLNLPRIAARFVLLFALSLAVVQVSMLGVQLGAGPAEPAPAPGDGSGSTGPPSTPGGLRSGDEVLGEPETVTPGGENLSAQLGRQTGPGSDEQERSYETGGLDQDAIQAERAAYAPPDDIENAELIKEYNLRIREETDD